MATLLILGSKPEPALPQRGAYQALACANASGFSAARHGLPIPTYTVMTAVLTSGKAEDNHSLRVLRGLETRALYFLPRPAPCGGAVKRTLTHLKQWRLKPFHMRHQLRRLGYRFDRFVVKPASYYHALVCSLCDNDPEILELIRSKQPSTGMFALAIGLAGGAYDRFILSGFDFGLRHAYGDSPLIHARGTTKSKHADTDVTILRHLAAKHRGIATTEPAVHERTGVPLLRATCGGKSAKSNDPMMA
jgi:hypothetical protein